jgi:hypothetical protein
MFLLIHILYSNADREKRWGKVHLFSLKNRYSVLDRTSV